jgi:hypothetical protein
VGRVTAARRAAIARSTYRGRRRSQESDALLLLSLATW